MPEIHFRHAPLLHDTDIRIIKLYPADHFEDPIHVKIEHNEFARSKRLSPQDSMKYALLPSTYGLMEDDRPSKARDHFSGLSFGHEVFNHDRPSLDPSDPVHGGDSDAEPLLYEAVSYAWGEDAETECIFNVSNDIVQSVLVRSNVVEMLRYLRRRSTQRVLWIDAICIDQANYKEREDQVSIMGYIYSQATRVVIWVGPPDPKQSLFDLLHGPHSSTYEATKFVALQDFIHRRWFKRRWVIQEVILAREAIIVCGNQSCEFSIFALDILGKLVTWSGDMAIPRKVSATDDKRLQHLADLVAFHHEVGIGRLQKRSMAELLIRFRAAECSDDRDIFYALNSLSNTPVPVSYQESIGEVCYRYTCSELVRCPSRLLSCAAAFPADPGTSATWIPDWTRSLKHKLLASSYLESTDTAGLHKSVKIDGMTIIMKAYPTDRVRIAWKPDPSHNGSALPGYKIFFENHRKIAEQDLIHGFDSFLVRVLTNGLYSVLYKKTEIAQFHWAVDYMMSGRTCFFTEAGHFGMGPQSIKDGDLLINMPGSEVVLALHPLESDELRNNTHQPSHHAPNSVEDIMTVVGDCYVPELTNTESLDGERELRTYRIV